MKFDRLEAVLFCLPAATLERYDMKHPIRAHAGARFGGFLPRSRQPSYGEISFAGNLSPGWRDEAMSPFRVACLIISVILGHTKYATIGGCLRIRVL